MSDESVPASAPPSMVERMTLILDMFVDRNARMRLDEIASGTGLPRSTCHRILEQLVQLNWLRHSHGGYGFGRRALQLGGATNSHDELRSAAVSLLQGLHHQTGQIVQLAVLDFSDVIYLDQIGGPAGSGLPTRVGGRAPAHSVALGKAMLAWLAPEEADTLLEGELKARTPNTMTDMLLIHGELRRIRARHGIAFERDEYVVGLSSVAAAVRGHEGALASISLCTPTHSGPLEPYAPLVLDVARRISRRLFPDAAPEELASTVWSDGMMERILSLVDDDVLM